MYLDQIILGNFRTFRSTRIDFVHPDQDYDRLGFEAPALLKAVALVCLGPAVGKAGLFPYRLIRREPQAGKPAAAAAQDEVAASVTAHFTQSARSPGLQAGEVEHGLRSRPVNVAACAAASKQDGDQRTPFQ